MTEREDSDQPRKRIAVACGRCRKRKIRCSGDPGNGGPCSNCKNAGYEPCLFLRVSSQETPLKDTTDFTYNLEAARTYAHHSRGPVSPLSPIPQYAHEMAAGEGLASYRQNPYAYGSGGSSSRTGYYPTMSGWAGAYQDDSAVDYSLNYSAYQILNPEPSALVSGYSPYGGSGGGGGSSRKSVYVDPEAGTSYTYGSLTHRPAAAGDGGGGGQGFSLSSMAASLPMPSPSDRLHSSINRTLTSSSSYRTDGLPPTAYASGSGGGSGKAAVGIPDGAYGNLQPAFESAYPSASTIASAIAHRATAHADATYPTSAAATDQLYAPADQPIRSTEDAGVSYVYSDSKLCGIGNGGGGAGGGGGSGGSGSGSISGSRRDSPSNAGVVGSSLLSNGHAYVPESHSAHPGAHAYVVPGVAPSAASSSSQGRTAADVSGGPARGSGSGGGAAGNDGGSGGGVVGGSSHRLSDSHNRRSAGSLRGV
ncbi:hypothetical protein F5Y14DRAFT_444074 [Nemania sp. NC0429]|nr:hypothetical protein F5Y14DRAFT_444074 [Nemania sp. NC0429]